MSKKRKADALPSEFNPSKLGKSDKSASQVDDVKRRPAGRLDKVRSAMPQGLNLSRKDLRKEMRQLKKSRRNAYSQKSKVQWSIMHKINMSLLHLLHFCE